MSMFIPLAGGRMSCLPRSLLCSLSANRKCRPCKSSRQAKVSRAAWLCPGTGRVGTGSQGVCTFPSRLQKHPALGKHLVLRLTHIFC